MQELENTVIGLIVNKTIDTGITGFNGNHKLNIGANYKVTLLRLTNNGILIQLIGHNVIIHISYNDIMSIKLPD